MSDRAQAGIRKLTADIQRFADMMSSMKTLVAEIDEQEHEVWSALAEAGESVNPTTARKGIAHKLRMLFTPHLGAAERRAKQLAAITGDAWGQTK